MLLLPLLRIIEEKQAHLNGFEQKLRKHRGGDEREKEAFKQNKEPSVRS